MAAWVAGRVRGKKGGSELRIVRIWNKVKVPIAIHVYQTSIDNTSYKGQNAGFEFY